MDTEEAKTERRKSLRMPCSGIVSLRMLDGVYRGATLTALLHDLSDGGVCVFMDGGQFQRGTAVMLELHEGLPISAWVCHSRRTSEHCQVGLSFHPVGIGAPEQCWEPEFCQHGTVHPNLA